MSGEMTCPDCGEQMVRGAIKVRGTKGGFLMFGFSWQHLWWIGSDERPDRRRLLTSGESCVAYACGPCGTVTFRPFQ